MAKGFKHGSGGGSAGLNFRVLGGTTAPLNPRENDIWVNTNMSVSEWGFGFENPFEIEEDLFQKGQVTSGYYIQTETGNAMAHDSYSYVEIELPSTASQLTITAASSASDVSHAFYDAEGNFISTIHRKTGTLSYDIPSGAKTAKITLAYHDTESIRTVHYGDTSDGATWFSTGTSSPIKFNTLKKNAITVYPISAKQYVGGAWVDVTAKSYQGGTWVDWIIYFYENGNTHSEVTGGFAYGTGVTLEADNIKMYCAGQTEIYARTNNKIDLSAISTLYIKAHVTVECQYNNNGQLHFYATGNAISGIGQATGGGATKVVDYVPGTNEDVVVGLDVSTINDSKYIYIGVNNPGKQTYTTFNIKEIWGE